MTKKQYSERRAADREKMAQIIEGIVQECGAISFREDAIGPHELWVKVEAARGLRVTVDFDGDSPQPDTYVLSWYMHYDSDARLNPSAFGGDVHKLHGHKATYVAHGFDDLCQQLAKGLRLAASGEAFQN